MAAFLTNMERDKPSGPVAGWFKTHPTPADRLAKVQAEIAALTSVPAKLDIRTDRFAAELKRLK